MFFKFLLMFFFVLYFFLFDKADILVRFAVFFFKFNAYLFIISQINAKRTIKIYNNIHIIF
jgi:hypothetical protein